MSKQVLIYVNLATHCTNRLWVYASPDYLRKHLPQVKFSYFAGDAFRPEPHELTSAVQLMDQVTSSEELLSIIHAIETQAHEENERYRLAA